MKFTLSFQGDKIIAAILNSTQEYFRIQF